ncbi:hypothetical protein K443DRAFT_8149 [Laccaria amethystina LaAM-08-1]|uniref:Peptidase C19 ubiquitin carboxyl-terminal hydrolase domain-containing protein n=1 Tax=Laccaria amethystina LaAM-08-1 TaxID=1095629 RepID=A0A0C9XDR9_9AGAR|nr:hypothetical protein K443DRAFT_8149 [Laccaria amethystina LaAM-08-1]
MSNGVVVIPSPRIRSIYQNQAVVTSGSLPIPPVQRHPNRRQDTFNNATDEDGSSGSGDETEGSGLGNSFISPSSTPPEEMGSHQKLSASTSSNISPSPACHNPHPPTTKKLPCPPKPVIMRPAYKHYLIATPPPVLAVHLKRFQQIAKTHFISFSHGFKKLDDYVTLPELGKRRKDRVDGEKEGERGEREKGEERYIHRLYAVVVHIGNMAIALRTLRSLLNRPERIHKDRPTEDGATFKSAQSKPGHERERQYIGDTTGLKTDGGMGTTLVPDEVVVEMKIDMADPPPTSTSDTISRVHVHTNGVRAKVKGMGYYFKYPILGGCIYEDEGVLSVDVGMGATGAGFGIDVEVEIESRSVPLEYEENMVIPAIFVHGEEEQQVNDGDDDDDGPPNFDIQKAVAQAVRRSAAVASPAAAAEINVFRHDASTPASVISEPLFRVVDVEVALRGLNFKIDQSRHWILNKLVLQPLVGPTVSRLVKKALEDKVRAGLEELSLGLGDAIVDVQRNAVAREGAEGTLGRVAVIGDWVRALFKALIKHTHRDDTERVDGLKTTTRVDATLKGVVYTSTTAQQQPTATPPMAYDRSSKKVNATAPRGGKGRQGLEDDSEVDAYEAVVAVGDGPQLFPGKGGPYGARNDDAASGGNDEERQGLIEGLKRLADDAVDGVRRGREVVGDAGAYWDKRMQVEAQGNGWRSEAFNVFDAHPSL